MKLYIYGAGMAGLLAANMLRRFNPVVREAQGALPNNHAAVLRFRSKVVSEATNIPFQEVHVSKAVKWNGGMLGPGSMHLTASNRYAQKVSAAVLDRSILNIQPATRFIAPPDFIAQLASFITVEYHVPLTLERLLAHKAAGDVVISTIPMPALMEIVAWEACEFTWRPITSIRGRIVDPHTNVYQTIYYPQGEDAYRASITGNELIIESLEEEDLIQRRRDLIVAEVLEDFGFQYHHDPMEGTTVKHQTYGKLLPACEKMRRAFILAMTDQHQIYSLGRFATWRQLLLDDVVHDVRVVERFIMDRDDYGRHLFARKA